MGADEARSSGDQCPHALDLPIALVSRIKLADLTGPRDAFFRPGARAGGRLHELVHGGFGRAKNTATEPLVCSKRS